MIGKKGIFSRGLYIILIIFIVILLLIGLYYFRVSKEGFFFIDAYNDLPSETLDKDGTVEVLESGRDGWFFANSSGLSQVDYAIVDPKIPYKNNTLHCYNGSVSNDVQSLLYLWYTNDLIKVYQNTSTLTGTNTSANFTTGLQISCGIVPMKGDSGIIAYWPFDEGSGTVFYEIIGNKSGTATQGIWNDGRYYKALYVNSSINLTIENPNGLNLSRNFTYEFWIKPDSSANKDLFSFNGTFRIYFKDSKIKLSFPIVGEGITDRIQSASNVTSGNWTQYAFTYDNSTIKIYINGVLDNSSSLSGQLDEIPAGNIYIGRNPFISGIEFNGYIDEIAIYNSSLTAQEIQDHFQRGIAILSKNTTTEADMFNYDFNNGTYEQTKLLTSTNQIILDNSSSTEYYTEGYYTSRIFEYPNEQTNTFLKWAESKPSGTNITFQIRSGKWRRNETIYWTNYSGPDPCYANDASIILAVPFSEGDNNQTQDRYGNYYINLTYNDFDSAGKHGYGIYFYGLNAMEIPSDSPLRLTSPENYTLEMWVNPATNDSMAFFNKDKYFMYKNSYGNVIFNASYSGSWVSIASNNIIPAGQWSHIMVTYDADNILKLYLNGNLEKTKIVSGNIDYSENILDLGNATGLNNYNGSIDSFVIYNRTLSPDEAYLHGKDIFTSAQGQNAGDLHRFIQYKILFQTNNTSQTPKIGTVILNIQGFENYVYNQVPSIPTLLSPENNTYIESESILFNWTNSTDLEIDNPRSYEILIANDSAFSQLIVSRQIINNFSESGYEDDNNTVIIEHFNLKRDMIEKGWYGNWTDTFKPGWKGEGLSIVNPGYFMMSPEEIINTEMGSVEFFFSPYWNSTDEETTYFFQETNNFISMNRTGDILTASFGAENGSTLTSNISSWERNSWYHLGVSWDKEKNFSLFINGIKANTTYCPNLNDSAGNFYLGSNASRTNNIIANGIIDEFRISNAVRESGSDLVNNNYTWENFPDGTYYWKIRAVQTLYVRSQREGERDFSPWSDVRVNTIDNNYPSLKANDDIVKVYSLGNTSINLTSDEITYCEFRLDNGSYEPMTQTRGFSHNQSINITQYGQSTYHINCNDSANKYSNTTLTFYVFDSSSGFTFKNATQYNFIKDNETEVNLTYNNLEFIDYKIKTLDNITGKISAVLHEAEYNPEISDTGLPTGIVGYWTLMPDQQIINNLSQNITVSLRYYDSDVSSLSISTFYLFYFDPVILQWKKLDDTYCLKGDYNITFSTSTFGSYTLGNDATSSPSTETPSSGGSSSGGGSTKTEVKKLKKTEKEIKAAYKILAEKLASLAKKTKDKLKPFKVPKNQSSDLVITKEEPNSFINYIKRIAEKIKPVLETGLNITNESPWLAIIIYIILAGLGIFLISKAGLALVLAQRKEKVPLEELEKEEENIDSVKYYIYKNIDKLNMDQELLNKGWDADEIMRVIKGIRKLGRGQFENYIYRKLSEGMDEEQLVKILTEKKWDEHKVRREIERFKNI